MNSRRKMIDETAEEWRALGFFYDFDEAAHLWKINGSHSGLFQFVEILRQYATDPKNDILSEHDHLPPYRYLTITTWKKRELTNRGITGTVKDIGDFADLLESKLAQTKLGETFSMGSEYTPNAIYNIVFTVENDEFDPSSLDPMNWANNIEEK